ncbi:MAG: hypothetical protein HND27_09610 [Bacteroidetes bacterium]|nr:hypothetical protein [Bacteroidota bacterium]MBV6462557.1 hypothetical protein [Flavobacteriales bacterium]WKZ75182.1 MAG: hypothetical protein QY303_13650 [Vicingaceae bacterium]MCL4817390.1 hypothetical protein [Flavobacteriales bacterium]NOG96021.1 hypothetical protein [Bacteroidota bacterium]
MKTVFSILFLIGFSYSSFSQIQNKQLNEREYDINDPRNPNCPCHKLQKQAEDEYKQIISQTNRSKNNALSKEVSIMYVQDLDMMQKKEIERIKPTVENSNIKRVKNELQKLHNSRNYTTLKTKIQTKKLKIRNKKTFRPKRKPVSGSNLRGATKRVVCFVW